MHLSFSFSISSSNEYPGLISFIGFTGWSPCSTGDSQQSYPTRVQRHWFSGSQPSSWFSSHIDTWLLEKKKFIVLTVCFVGKLISLIFNMLSRFFIAFLPRCECPLVAWLQSPSTVILEPKKIKSITISSFSPFFAIKWWDWMPWS